MVFVKVVFVHSIPDIKLAPSLLYTSKKTDLVRPKIASSEQKLQNKIESLMKPDSVKKFEERFEEGYDVETDELYSIWSGLKKLSISDSEPSNSCASAIPTSDKTPSVLEEIIQYPNPPPKKVKVNQPVICQSI